ncbi:MAG: AraC family transcriptional regulator [Lachnospiraceae bacterium]|nr:AraC family transcriptional regulator [Lachnospiraceae bacterium]
MSRKANIAADGIMYPVAPPFDILYRNEAVAYPVGPHSHNAAELYYTLTDLPDVLINDQVSAVSAGTLLILPAFCVHQLYHETGVVYERYILSIHTGWLQSVFCENASAFRYLEESSIPVFLFPEAQQKNELLGLLDELLSFPDRDTPESMICFFQGLGLIQQMVKRSGIRQQRSLPVSPGQKKVNEVISYLSEHLSENPRITDLASHFFLNPDYLGRIFKSHMHVSLGRYILLQKISTAQLMLRKGQSVSQVQETLGFSSYAYFFRTFQKFTGMSPSRYRRQYCPGINGSVG